MLIKNDTFNYYFYCQGAKVYSAMWKSVGRKLELSARVVDGSVRGTIYPNVKFGLNGRKLLLVVKEVGLSYCN